MVSIHGLLGYYKIIIWAQRNSSLLHRYSGRDATTSRKNSVMTLVGLEPTTSRLEGEYSIQTKL